MLGFLSDLANRGKFHVKIEQRLSWTEASQAWEINRQGHTGGKIVLEVSH